MRIGLLTPIVFRVPGAHAAWEASAGVDDLVAVATTADRLGYHHLTCSEHTAVPGQMAPGRGATYWDPLATLSFLAAHTSTIRLATNVLVLPYHHPLTVVKAYGTLDRLSGGRVVLGVGIGSLRPEFDLLGAPFDGRAARTDDAIRAIRAAWAESEPRYRGTHHEFADVVIDPVAVQPQPTIWVDGRSAASLRRALTLGDGWMPFGLELTEVARLLADLGPPPSGFQVVLQSSPLDPIGAPDLTRELVGATESAGATSLNVRFRSDDRGHLLEQMQALTDIVPTGFAPAPDSSARTEGGVR